MPIVSTPQRSPESWPRARAAGSSLVARAATARLTHPAWVQLPRDQCVPAGIAFHHRQWGEWIKCDFAELPSSFRDPIIRNSALGCDNGYVSDISLEAATLHKPSRWSQCFPHGADGESDSHPVAFRRAGKAASGRMHDGRTWDEVPSSALVEGVE